MISIKKNKKNFKFLLFCLFFFNGTIDGKDNFDQKGRVWGKENNGILLSVSEAKLNLKKKELCFVFSLKNIRETQKFLNFKTVSNSILFEITNKREEGTQFSYRAIEGIANKPFKSIFMEYSIMVEQKTRIGRFFVLPGLSEIEISIKITEDLEKEFFNENEMKLSFVLWFSGEKIGDLEIFDGYLKSEQQEVAITNE